MKVNILQQRRALSVTLFVLLLNVMGTKNALAQNQIATLKHNDSISVFYGINSLVDAHSAAATGDVITLSEGSFNSCNITKAITLRGAGCRVDTVANTIGTIVPGDFQLNVPTNDSGFLTIEGILFTGTITYYTLLTPKFIKCGFYNIDANSSGAIYMTNAQFINCLIRALDYNKANNTVFVNSVICDANCRHYQSNSGETYYNSIVRFTYYMNNASAYNSIIISGRSSYYPYSSSIFFNCIGIKNGSTQDFFQYQNNSTNLLLDSYSDVFDTWRGTFSFEENFVLNDSVASAFLGNDGTEVGIYGGGVPYDPRPSYMVVKRYNVANKSTHDGKLSVDIELITEDE